jgi:hypothetical protein
MVIFFDLYLILAVIFSQFLKPNAAEMLREKKKEREREMKSKKEERENIFV